MKRLLLIIALLASSCFAQTVALSPVAKQIFFGSSGQYLDKPLSGGRIYTYAGGTTTPLATFIDSTGATPNPNPIVLDAAGFANIWLTAGTAYKFLVTDVNGVQQYTVDGITSQTSQSINANFASPPPLGDVAPNTIYSTVANGVINPLTFAGIDIGAKINSASSEICVGNVPCHIVIPALNPNGTAVGQLAFNTTITYANNMTVECVQAGGASEQTGGTAIPTVLKYTGSTVGIDQNGTTQPVLRGCSVDCSAMTGSATCVKETGASPIVENNYFIGGPVGTKVVNIGLSDGAQFKGNSAFEFFGDFLYVDQALDVHLVNNLAYGARLGGGLSNTTSRTLVVDSGTSGFHLDTFDAGSAGLHGFVMQDTIGGMGPPTYIFINGMVSDCSYGDGWLFDSSLSVFSIIIKVTNSWAAGAGQNCDGSTSIRSVAQGIHISGGVGYKFSNMDVRANAYNGFLIDNGIVQDVTIENSSLYGNNVANDSDSHGIYTSTFINGLKVTSNTITNNYQSLPSGNQKYGIKIGANGENVNITGNNLGGNVTGPILYPTSFGFNVLGNTNNNTPIDAVFSGNILAYGVASHGQGGCLIPQFGTASGFLMGSGINTCFDGTNFHFYTDATNNGGSALLGNQQGQGGLYAVATNGTPASDQTVSAASLAADELFAFTPTTFNFLVAPKVSGHTIVDLSGNLTSANGISGTVPTGTGTNCSYIFVNGIVTGHTGTGCP